jgi:UDP:flavonoid glycosyltransferase YjiC (YdhE family)
MRLGYKFNLDPFQILLGDLNLILDLPEYRPLRELPDNTKIVGPIFWEAKCKLPKWAKEIDKQQKIIYVSASGTGDREVFIKTLEFLQETDFTVVATTGNTLKPSSVNIKNSNIFITDYLPGDWIMKKAAVAIFPGGNGTAYQALHYGVPQVCTPLHLDQEDNANQLERLGTGLVINPYVNFSQDALLNAVGRVVVDKKYKINAMHFQKVISGYNGVQTAAKEIVKFMGQKSRNL